jgi:hypothetical protein
MKFPCPSHCVAPPNSGNTAKAKVEEEKKKSVIQHSDDMTLGCDGNKKELRPYFPFIYYFSFFYSVVRSVRWILRYLGGGGGLYTYSRHSIHNLLSV